MKKYNWGILGTGHIARKFVNDLKLLPNANCCAVGSRAMERAARFASCNGIDKVYGSYEALVSDPAVDIIYIASRHVGHYPDSLICLHHKKAVLCEKPVAMNRRQFETMVTSAKKNNVFFMEALWTRFLPSFIKCKEIVGSGLIGEVRLIESDFCMNAPVDPDGRLYNPALGGGSLLDIGLYPVFCALEIGGDITGINAMATLDANGIDTCCSILMSHSCGSLSVLFCSMTTAGRNESIIHGSKGIVRLNRWWHAPTSLDLIIDNKEPQHFTFDEPGYGYRHEAAEVMKSLAAGKQESVLWSWEHSRKLITTLDRIREIAGIKYSEAIEAL